MKTNKPVKPSREDLERRIKELEAQLVHRYAFGAQTIDKASMSKLMGSGVILTLTALGGKAIIEPVCIKDGLSDETINALKVDFRRSYDLAVMFKP